MARVRRELYLTNAASVTAVTIVGWSRPATRGRTWSVGVAALVVAVLSTLVAWASVLWQASLAVAFVLLAVGTDRPRTPIFAPAGAQLAGLAALFIGAGDVSIMLSSLLTAAAVWLTLRSAGEQSDR